LPNKKPAAIGSGGRNSSKVKQCVRKSAIESALSIRFPDGQEDVIACSMRRRQENPHAWAADDLRSLPSRPALAQSLSPLQDGRMCNLYNITTVEQAIREWTRAMRDLTGFNEPSRDVYPNFLAPVVRTGADGLREIVPLTWGMPTPPERVTGNADRGTTNIRQPNYSHWQQWMGVENRCIVPATSFAEPSPKPKDVDPATGIQRNFWFALDESLPVFAFAGVWTKWHGVRKVKDGLQDFELFGFLTTRPNAVVAPIHPKAMPVILSTQEEIETWLTGPTTEALRLQRPPPDDRLRIVPAPPTQTAEAFAAARAGKQPSLF